MPGPAPKKNARRRNARPDWVTLPAAGRPGKPPKFPIPVPPGKDGKRGQHPAGLADLWRELWASPHAVQWERLGWTRTVARYALLVLFSESAQRGSGKASEEARHMEDRLGLTPMAMKRLQWEVAEVAAAEPEADRSNVVDLASRMG